MKSINEYVQKHPFIGAVIFFVTMAIVFLLGLLASSIIERRAEAVFAYAPTVKYPTWEPRNELWGQNYPRQYQSNIKTSDTSFKSYVGGSAMIDELERNPRLVLLWAGYGFAKDYNQGRGHYYAVTDVRNTLRTGGAPSPMPNTCWTCKSPDVPRMMETLGVAGFYKGTLDQLGHQIVNPIGCADCHDAATMNLRISRPALIEAWQRAGKDIAQASHQEMRSLVCAQCHVEYYFNKKVHDGVQYLTFPWDSGLSCYEMESYYDQMGFSDWIHPISKAPMLKAQHPDYEIFSTGIHYERGVSCADCHMPYTSEGGQKFTDHHITSPLQYVYKSCQVCHREETDQLIKNVYDRQKKVKETKQLLEDALVYAHIEAGKAWELGATDIEMKDVLQDIRHAQWRWDFAVASHGASFHSPLETSRIMAGALNIVQDARIKLARLLTAKGFNKQVPWPDISTKEKAQQFIGLDMKKLKADKREFLNLVVPEWIIKAKEREILYPGSNQ